MGNVSPDPVGARLVDLTLNSVNFPKSYAFGVVLAIALLAIALLIGVYFYMQYSPRD